MKRPFLLMVDSGDPDEPDNRMFTSLFAASEALHKLPARYQRFAWIFERTEGGAIVHYKDGKKVSK